MCSFHGAFAPFLLTGLEGEHLTTFIPSFALASDFLLECQPLPELGAMPEGTRRKNVATGIPPRWCEGRMRKPVGRHRPLAWHLVGAPKSSPSPGSLTHPLFPPPSPRLMGGQILIGHRCGVSARGGGVNTESQELGVTALCQALTLNPGQPLSATFT